MVLVVSIELDLFPVTDCLLDQFPDLLVGACVNTNIGEVGDDVEVKGQVVNSEMVYTLNGATPKVTIKTDSNQKVVILGGELQSEGEEVEVRGRVQHHANFKGYKSTWVTAI